MNYPEDHSAVPIANFLLKHFREDGVKLFNVVKQTNGKMVNSKSNLTKQNFIELHQNKKTIVNDKEWSSSVSFDQATHYEVSLRAKHEVFCLDIDNKNVSWESIPAEFRKCPYTKSRNKALPHFWFVLSGTDTDKVKSNYAGGLGNKNIKWDDNSSFDDFDCDFLSSHLWERKEAEVFNWDGETIPSVDLFVLEKYLSPSVFKKLYEFSPQNEASTIQNLLSPVEANKTTKKVILKKETTKLKEIKNIDKTDKFVELLFDVIKNETDPNGDVIIKFDEWFSMMGMCKAYGMDRDTFVEWTNTYRESPKTIGIWDALNKISNPDVVYGLQTTAKKLNPSGYREWLIKHNEYLELPILEKGENDVAQFIGKFLNHDLVYCKSTWWSFNSKSGLWNEIAEPSARITSFTQLKINEAEQCFSRQTEFCTDPIQIKANMETKKKYMDHYKSVCKSSYNSQMVKYLKTYVNDEEFLDKLDITKYRIAFRNGVMNLKTLEFEHGLKREYFLTKTIPHDYKKPSDKEIAEVREIIKKICNYNDQHLEYYLSTLGYAFTGDSTREQNFWYLRGQTAQNGKSVIFETLEAIAPNYVLKANSDVLDRGADLRKEIHTWRGILILWLNEVSTKRKDEDIVKALCDGTGYKYNPLYSKSAVVMTINFKLFAVSNNTLEIKGDAGVKRRFRIQQFNSQFKVENTHDNYKDLQFKMDKDLGEKLRTIYCDALLHLIFAYSHDYYNEQILKPDPA
jgi:hypothetical protein